MLTMGEQGNGKTMIFGIKEKLRETNHGFKKQLRETNHGFKENLRGNKP